MQPGLVADENISRLTILSLRKRGFDVLAIAERCPGIRDAEVLGIARADRRWLITFDRDYGDLIFKRGLAAPPGVIYLRFIPAGPEEPAERITAALEKTGDLNAFVVVGRKGGMRVRPLPSSHDG